MTPSPFCYQPGKACTASQSAVSSARTPTEVGRPTTTRAVRVWHTAHVDKLFPLGFVQHELRAMEWKRPPLSSAQLTLGEGRYPRVPPRVTFRPFFHEVERPWGLVTPDSQSARALAARVSAPWCNGPCRRLQTAHQDREVYTFFRSGRILDLVKRFW